MDKFLREKKSGAVEDDKRQLGQDEADDDDEDGEMVDRKPAFFSVNNKKIAMGGLFAGEQDHFGMLIE
jgi:hypothetical protein